VCSSWHPGGTRGLTCGSSGKESTCSVGDLGWGDPLEKGRATHSSILAWRRLYSPWGRKESDTTEWLSLSSWQRYPSGTEPQVFFYFIWNSEAKTSPLVGCCQLLCVLSSCAVTSTYHHVWSWGRNLSSPLCSRAEAGCSWMFQNNRRKGAENNLWELPRRIGILLPLTRLSFPCLISKAPAVAELPPLEAFQILLRFYRVSTKLTSTLGKIKKLFLHPRLQLSHFTSCWRTDSSPGKLVGKTFTVFRENPVFTQKSVVWICGPHVEIPSNLRKWKSLSHVQLFVTPWNSPGQNTGVGSFSLLQGSSQPRDQTEVSHIASRFFTS